MTGPVDWNDTLFWDAVMLRVMGITAYARERMQAQVPFPLDSSGDTVSAGPDGFAAEYGRGSEPGAPWVHQTVRSALSGYHA